MEEKQIFIDSRTGLLNIADYYPSPNCDEREGQLIDLLVIHNISLPPGEFGSNEVMKFFTNNLDFSQHPFYEQLMDLKVSSHLFIPRAGTVKQFVPFHLRAWHAGDSFFDGRTKCNDFSIGIELEGTDDIPYTSTQYLLLATITKQIMGCYPAITFDRIVGHHTIAPTRKTDPGPAFEWQYYKDLLKKELTQ